MGAATSAGQKQSSSPQIPVFMIEAHKKHMRPLYISQGRRGKVNYTTYIEDIPIMAETLAGLEALYIKAVKEIPRQPINATRRNNRSGPVANISKPTNQTARSPGIRATIKAAGRGAATAVASAAQTVRNKARRVGTDENGNPKYGIQREFRAAGQQAAAAARVAAQATATGARGVARGASAAAGMAARGASAAASGAAALTQRMRNAITRRKAPREGSAAATLKNSPSTNKNAENARAQWKKEQNKASTATIDDGNATEVFSKEDWKEPNEPNSLLSSHNTRKGNLTPSPSLANLESGPQSPQLAAKLARARAKVSGSSWNPFAARPNLTAEASRRS